MEEEVVKELLKGMQLLLSIKNAEEEVVVEEEDVEELLKITQEEGVMVEIAKALVHRWKRHSDHSFTTR